MKSKKGLAQFTEEALLHLNIFDAANMSCVKEVIKLAITYYELKSEERVELVEGRNIEVLYLHSMMEENILTKVVELTTGKKDEITIEAVYNGSIVRKH